MPKLNLEAKNETQKIIKDYLEKNVSDMLAEKINKPCVPILVIINGSPHSFFLPYTSSA